MTRTITGSYPSGVALTNAGDNPVTIASGASVAYAAGIGLQSTQPVAWSITNEANANISGNTFGVSLASASIFDNSGNITSSYASGSGFSYDNTSHTFTVKSAALYMGGGYVTNAAGGIISGGVEGVAFGANGSVSNAGSIGAPAGTLGFGIALAAGGGVANLSGGQISAADYGIFSDGAVSVTNQTGAVIAGTGRGIFAINSAATIANQGVIRGGRYGVGVSGGASTVTNTGAITAGYGGVVVSDGSGTVTNAGTIENQTTFTSQSFAFGGVLLVSGGLLDNGGGGVISSTNYGAWIYGGAGTLTNAGTIASSRTGGGAGVAVLSGGSVTNAAGGVITGEWIGVQSGPFGSSSPSAAAAITVDNSGTISAADGKGDGAAVWVHGPGVVINRASGVIEGSTNNTVVGGPLNGLRNGGFGVVAYYQTTLINYGSIGGASYAFTAGTNSVGDLVEMAPGASFGGVVLGAKTSAQASQATLELLSGASVGTVTNFGSQYRNFGNITVDNGAQWNLGGTVAAGTNIAIAGTGALTFTNPTAMQGTISGFTNGQTLTLPGITVTDSSFANGVLSLTDASGTIALDLAGTFSTGEFTVANGSSGATVTVNTLGLLAELSVPQQLELTYIAYFNRAADSAGLNYWEMQNAQARQGGQTAIAALTNVANAFAPQPETEALYPSLDPYLAPNPPPLNTPDGQSALTTFIDAVYSNLFNRTADPAGVTYWVGQLSGGAVAIGAAALAIANGAIGPDAIEAMNKVTVALDFTTRTGAAGLGQSEPLTASLSSAAQSVLSGVDGTALNDASVSAAMNATTAYIAGNTSGFVTTESGIQTVAAANNPITVSVSNSVIDPGAGSHTIQFLTGTSGDTLVLRAGGLDQVSGFDPATDILDLRALLSAANVDLNGNFAALGNYVTVTDQGADALLNFSPTGQGGGAAVAVLRGPGGAVTNLDTLVSQGAIRIT